jgi:hypothetical protein
MQLLPHALPALHLLQHPACAKAAPPQGLKLAGAAVSNAAASRKAIFFMAHRLRQRPGIVG